MSRLRLQYMGLVLAVHGLCTHSTRLLYSEYKDHVLKQRERGEDADRFFCHALGLQQS